MTDPPANTINAPNRIMDIEDIQKTPWHSSSLPAA
jgi:hypothetical protein